MNVEYATYHGLAPKTDYYNNIPWASAKRSDLSRLATYIHILKIWWIQSSTFWDNIGLQEKEKRKKKHRHNTQHFSMLETGRAGWNEFNMENID